MKYDKDEERWYTDEDYENNKKKKIFMKYLRFLNYKNYIYLFDPSMKILCASFLIITAYYLIYNDGTTYTLYRNSSSLLPGGEIMRIHIATFDTNESDGESSFFGLGMKDSNEAYNKAECEITASLFQNQQGVKTRYWCEKGRYHK